MTITKQRPAVEHAREDLNGGKWTMLFFSKDGRSHLICGIAEPKTTVKMMIEINERAIKQHIKNGFGANRMMCKGCSKQIMLWQEYSHIVPMPVK